MNSGTLEKTGSPRKRTLSRGVSEDESLRNIIKEAESTRRLTRSDSRGGTLKRSSDSQPSEHDLVLGLPEMVELQESYDEVVQELRGLEVQREVLIFQVDVLQDALEETEELLAESQREASQTHTELEREREANKKLEKLVNSLIQEMKILKEEKDTMLPDSVCTLDRAQESVNEMAIQQAQRMKKDSEARGREEENTTPDAPISISRLNAIPIEIQNYGALVDTNTVLFQSTQLGSSVDCDEGDGAKTDHEASTLNKIQKTCIEMATMGLNIPSIQDRNLAENERDLSPDGNNDTDSNYEDAFAHTPEFDHVLLGSSVDGSDNAGCSVQGEGSASQSCEVKGSETFDSKGDSCILS